MHHRLSVLAGLFLTASVAAAQSVEPVITLLEKEGSALIGPIPPPARVQVLKDLGFRIQFSAGTTDERLSWEQLKRFNMLFMSNFATTHGRKPYEDEYLADLLDRYLREGGAILYIGQEKMHDFNEHEETNRWLKRYGAQIRWAVVDDPAHAYANPPKLPYQNPHIWWTTNIAEHPATQGADTLFVRNGIMYCPYIRPLDVDENWTVLVRSMPTAETWEVDVPAQAGYPKRLEGTMETGAVPLLAVRQVGKGRLAIFASNPAHYWYDLGTKAGGQICWLRGDGERESDWLPLLRNLSLWLTEPAREAGFPGGASDEVAFQIRGDWGSRESIEWDRPDITWTDGDIQRLWGVHSSLWNVEDWHRLAEGEYPSFKILVGARSVRSGGKGTVEDWKAAALAAGYDGVAFREDLWSMDRASWEAFERECEAASDDTFIALAGQQFHDWEGNRFLRFHRHIPWHTQERLTEAGDAVRSQLHFFFDCGNLDGRRMLPANLPLYIKGNPTPYWSYRVYDAIPAFLYEDGQVIEDNLDEWKDLVKRLEYITPLAVHLLDDPSEVAATADDYQVHLIAPSMRHLREDPRWGRRAMGIGHPYCTAAYLSNGPEIRAFQPINGFRTALGSMDVPGSFRWRFYLRAVSEEPIETVEIWAGGELLRRWYPGRREVLMVSDDIHDRQKGVFVKVIDAAGKIAYATSWNVHDKNMYLQWCGDHCNMLGAACGVDANGNPSMFGIGSHVRMKWGVAGGPGAAGGEARTFIPYGTDTGSPTLNVWGGYRLMVPGGTMPAGNLELVPNLRLWHCNRHVRISRLISAGVVDRNRYLGKDAPKPYDSGYFSAWGAYFRVDPFDALKMIHFDIDLHRNAGDPAFQLCRGELTAQEDIALRRSDPYNWELGRSGWGFSDRGVIFPDGSAEPGTTRRQLTRGEFFTWANPIGHGTLFPLDDNLGLRVETKDDGSATVFWGYQLGERTIAAGETVPYGWVCMRWPVGVDLDEKLDARVADLLFGPNRLQLSASRGTVEEAEFGFMVTALDHVFAGNLPEADLSVGIPLRVSGVNPNWVAGLWQAGMKQLAPLSPDPDGILWSSINPALQSGAFAVGNALVCNDPDVLLRLFRRDDGSWEILVHNPKPQAVDITVQGTPAGPVDGFKATIHVEPGRELRVTVDPAAPATSA